MTWTLLLGGAVFVSAWLLVPGESLVRRRGFLESGNPKAHRFSRAIPHFFDFAILGLGLAAAWTSLTYGWVVMLLFAAAGACIVAVRRLVTASRRRKHRRRQQVEVLGLCDALAAEMRAGLTTQHALERSCATIPELSSLVSAERVGGDVAGAMRLSAAQPGAEGLRAVAAAWEVAACSGAALADVLDRVAAGMRQDDEARSEVAAALGPPRATARLLTVLPVFGLAMGTSMGAAPLTFLLHSRAGWICLALGASLATLGLLWVDRLAESAEI